MYVGIGDAMVLMAAGKAQSDAEEPNEKAKMMQSITRNGNQVFRKAPKLRIRVDR